jgi:hypothetical protein
MYTLKRKICKKCYSNFEPNISTETYCSNCKIENYQFCNAIDNKIKCKKSCIKNKKYCLNHMIEFADIMDGIFRCNIKGCYNELENKTAGKCKSCIAGNEPNMREKKVNEEVALSSNKIDTIENSIEIVKKNLTPQPENNTSMSIQDNSVENIQIIDFMKEQNKINSKKIKVIKNRKFCTYCKSNKQMVEFIRNNIQKKKCNECFNVSRNST